MTQGSAAQPSRPLRVAVVGADVAKRGFGARAHLPAVLATPGIELAAICTAHEQTAEQSARAWHAPRWYGDYHRVMADPDIDLVTIAVNVPGHFPIAQAALNAGKMVYCEWPLCMNSQDEAELVRLAEAGGIVTAAGTQGRHAPGVLYLKELLQQGIVGRPLFFHLTHFLPRFPVRSDHWWSAHEPSGALTVATGHSLDTLQYLLGQVTAVCGMAGTLMPEDCYADTGEPFKWTVPDTVGFLARLATGVEGTVHVSNLATRRSGFRLDIFGEQGQVLCKAPRYISYTPARLYRARRDEEEMEALPIPERFYRVTGISEESTGFNIAQALSELARASRTGEEFHPSFADAHRLHLLIEGIRTSAHEGKWVTLA